MIKYNHLFKQLKNIGCGYILLTSNWIITEVSDEAQLLLGNIQINDLAYFFTQNYSINLEYIRHKVQVNTGSFKIICHYTPLNTEHELCFISEDEEITLFIREISTSSEILLKELFDLAPVAMMAYDFERDKVIVNDNFSQLIGYQNQDLKSMNDWLSLAFPEENYRLEVYNHWFEGISNVKAGEHTFVPFDSKVRCKNGTFRYFDVSFKLLKQFTVLSFIDVTERVLTQINLEESRSDFQRITDEINEILWITNSTDDEVLFINKSFEKILSGYSQNLSAIKDFYTIIHPDDLPKLLDAQQAYLNNTSIPIRIATRVILSDGICRWFELVKFPLLNEQLQVYKHVGLANDVTSKIEEQLKFERLNQLQNTLAKLSITFINKPYQDFQNELVNILETVGKSTQTSRAFIYKYEQNQGKLIKTHEWICPTQVIESDDQLLEIAISKAKPLFNKLIDDKILYVYNIEELSSFPRVFDALLKESVGSIIVLPFFEGNEVIGVLGLMTSKEQRAFGKDEIELLKVLAELIQNVTIRYNVENSLIEREQEFRGIFENLSEGIVYQNRDGSVIRANKSASKILGIENINTTTISQLFKEVKFLDTNKVTIDLNHLPFARALATGQPVIGEIVGIKYQSITQEKWLRVNAIPEFKEEDCIPFRIFCTFVDITEQKTSVDFLKESEEKYKRLTDNIKDIVYRIELVPQKKFTYVSQSIRQIIGYEPEDFYNGIELASNVIYVDDRDKFTELMEKKNFFNTPIMLRWVKKTGEIVWVEQRCVPIYNSSNELIAVEGIIRDITDSKKAFDNLHYLSRLQEILMRVFLDYISITSSEADAKINTALEELANCIQVDHLFIANYRDSYSSFVIKNEWRKTNPDTVKTTQIELEQRLEEIYQRHIQGDSYHFVIEYTSMVLEPIFTRDELVGFVGIKISKEVERDDKFDEQILKMLAKMLTNILERQKIISEIEESRQLLNNIINNNGSVIYVKNLQGVYQIVNSTWESVLNISKSQALGKTDFDLFPEDFAKEFISNDLDALNSGQTLYFEEKVIIDSEKRDFISVKFPVRDSANQLIGVAGMSTDITRIRNIEKALRESEANLKAILDSSSESIWSINTNFEIIYANKVVRRDYLESFGVELHKGINILNALPDLVKKEWKSRYQQVFENKVIQFNDKIPTHNKTYYLEISMNPILLDDQVVGVSVFSKNISKEKYAINDVLRYNNIFENLLNEIYLFEVHTLKFLGANKAAIDNIGYSAEELVCLTPVDIKPLIGRNEFLELINPLITGQKKKLIFETIHRRKNLTQYPVEVHLQIVEIEQERQFVAIVVDITERKTASLALIESENRFRRLFQNNASIMYIINPDNGQFVDMNDACINFYGWTRNEFSQLNILDINTSEDDVTRKFELITKNKGQVFETKQRNKGGVVFDMEIYSCMIEIGSQNLIFEIAHDVTDRNKYFNAVEIQNKTLKDIAWVQSHVVRAPLSRLMGLVLLLKDGMEDSEIRAQCLNHIISSAFEIDQIIKDITNKTYSVKELEMNINNAIATKHKNVYVSIVDDDSSVQLLHKLLIEKVGIATTPNQFLSGLGMLNFIASHDSQTDVHIIFLDINMPEMNGWEFLENLNKRYLSCTVKVVIVSSSIDQADYNRAWTYPWVIEFFSKPLDLKKLNELKSHVDLSDFFKENNK